MVDMECYVVIIEIVIVIIWIDKNGIMLNNEYIE